MAKTFHIGRLFKNESLTNSEIKILEYIIDSPERVKKEGIRQLAKANFTSTASVVRLAKKLGYSGYNELLFDIKKMTNKPIIEDPKSKINTSILPSLEEIKSYFNKEKYIYIYGEGFCEFVTGYIHRKLLVKKFNVILLHGLEIPIVYDEKHNPTLLLISKSGETFSCIKKIEQMRDLNGHVVSITSNSNSTIARSSNITFSIPDNNITDNTNEGYTNFFGNCINLLEDIFSNKL